MRAKVCIIADGCTKGDAISAAIAADCRALQASGEFDPFLLSEMCQVTIPHANIRGLRELVYHPRFVDADIRIFHFGFYSELFNACMLGKERVKRILRFHNVTPAEIVDPSQRERIEKARRQVAVVAKADEVWPISPFNGRTLAAMGFQVDLEKTLFMPITPLTERLDPRSKGGPITIAYVGRIVPAKGVHFLLDAFELLAARGHTDVELVVIGSTYIRGYAAGVRARIDRGRLKNARFLGRVSQAKLARAYERASIVAIPSLHEGLCVPVIEALYAGAIPVVSDTAALPETLNGLGRLTPVGNPVALADCLEEVIADIRGIRRNPDNATIRVERGTLSLDEYYAAVSRHLESFSPTALSAELIHRLRALTPSSSPSTGQWARN
jgi:glycosyltransferase involved in cell wall biosynthesis